MSGLSGFISGLITVADVQGTPVNITFIEPSIGALTFDATIDEEHESDLTVTDAPVETGAVVSDNAFLEPKKLTMQIAVSDNPLYLPVNDPYQAGSSRSISAWQALCDLQATLEPLTAQSSLKLYPNMMISKLRAKRDKDTGQILFAEVALREVILTYTQIINYPPRATGSTTRQAGAANTKGDQQGDQQGSTPPTPSGSILGSIFNPQPASTGGASGSY